MKRTFLLPCFWILLLLAACAPALAPATATLPPSLQPTSEDNPTAGAIVRNTREAKATLQRQATLEALAATQAQDAENAARTATAVSGMATAQVIATRQADFPPLLRDDFSDQNPLGWPLGLEKDDALQVQAALKDNFYHWQVIVYDGNSYFNFLPEKSPVLGDFYASITVTFLDSAIDANSAYGLVFRHNEDDYGFFGIDQGGRVRWLEVHDTGIYQLIEEHPVEIDTRPGQPNRLAVAAIGNDFVLMVNDQVVGYFSAELEPGQVGVGVDALTSSPEESVTFSDFVLRSPEQ